MIESKPKAWKLTPNRWFYAIVGLIGVIVMYHPTLLSGFTKMQADPGDTRLNQYFLEHSFQMLVNRDYKAALWSPAFFYPFKNALAFSDNLFGSAPIYWAFRTLFSDDHAFQLWAIVVVALCFITFVQVLRRFRVSPVLSALGGFLFAFGLPRASQMGHHQLFPQFFTPIAFLFVWDFLQKPTPNRLRWSLILLYLQILAGVYLGWYFVFSLLIFVPAVLLFDAAKRDALVQFVKTYWKSTAIAVLLWCIATVLLFLPYLEMRRIIGEKPYAEVASMLPRITSWFLPAPNSLWWSLLSPIAKDLPMAHEHQLFLGFVAFSLVAFAVYKLRSILRILSPEHALLVKACFATCLVIFILSLSVFDRSLWWFIYKLIPGATSMRAMTRIAFIVYFYLLLGTLIGVNAVLVQTFRPAKVRNAIALGLLLLSLPEQLIWAPYFFDRPPVLAIEAELQELMRQDCDFAYVAQTPDEPFYSQQIRAMWAGIRTNTPVINGYSGADPPGLPMRQDIALPNLLDWLHKTTKGRIKGNLCLIQSTQPAQGSASNSRAIPIASIADTRILKSSGGNFTSAVISVPPNTPLKVFEQGIRVIVEPPKTLTINSEINLPILVRNTSDFTWFQGGNTPIHFSYRWLNQRQEVEPIVTERTALPFNLVPDQAAAINARITTPSRPGRYTLQLTMVQEYVNWFTDRGAKPLNLPITLIPDQSNQKA